jgi:hypothetical protein
MMATPSLTPALAINNSSHHWHHNFQVLSAAIVLKLKAAIESPIGDPRPTT